MVHNRGLSARTSNSQSTSKLYYIHLRNMLIYGYMTEHNFLVVVCHNNDTL